MTHQAEAAYRMDIAMLIKQRASFEKKLGNIKRAREDREWATTNNYHCPTKVIKSRKNTFSIIRFIKSLQA